MSSGAKSDLCRRQGYSFYSTGELRLLAGSVAVARGFFKDENLEPLLIQMPASHRAGA